jgi:AraC family transcriptional regulator
MKLIIRNMVCPRCVESVRNILAESGVKYQKVELGEVETEGFLTEEIEKQLSEKLQEKGFELTRDRESELTEKIRVTLLDYLEHLEKSKKPNKLSIFISEKLHYNYAYLSKLFSDKTGVTIESYLIKLKIERVKELLGYRSYTLSEIAWRLKYSSVQYLSNQFKNITGITVTEYLNQDRSGRKTIDQI